MGSRVKLFEMLTHLVSFLTSTFLTKHPIHPIILVPGDGGSQIEARIDRSESLHFWCYDHTDWYDLWLNIEQMIPPAISCWEENIRLRYDPVSRTTDNMQGVQTRIPGFGHTHSVEYLDKSGRSVGIYFADIVKHLTQQAGYVRGKNIRGAPYDFRKAGNEHDEYFQKMKLLIEETYMMNKNVPVILLGHSMGSIMTLQFLTGQTQEWKDKYIRSFISLAGVWGGTVDAVKVFAVGDNLKSRFLSEKSLLWQRSCPSLAWLMPSKDFWSENEALVQTDAKNFTRVDLEHFYNSVSDEYGPSMNSMVKDTENLLSGLPSPNVEVHCIHGSLVDTIEKLVYAPGAFPSSDPDYVYGDGDGTVNIRSLKGCLTWRKKQKQPVFYKQFEKLDHLGMLRERDLIEYLTNIITEINGTIKRKTEEKMRNIEMEYGEDVKIEVY